MKHKTEYLLTIRHELSNQDIAKHNAKTVYAIARNIRKLEPIATKFDADRSEALKDEWFKKYSEMEDKEKANETYKVELAELEKEIKDLLEVEVEHDFYQITIDDVSFEGVDVVKFMDLIKE